MKKRVRKIMPAIFIFAVALSIFFIITRKPQPAPAPQEKLPMASSMFRNARYGFTVRYPDQLQLLEDKSKMEVSGYIPACDPQTAIACFLLPREAYAGKNFDGAGFAVNVLKGATTEKKCLAPAGNAQPAGSEIVNGVIFMVFTDGDAAMSHRSQGKDYRAFKNKTCFDLTTRINTTTFEVYEPGMIQKFTDADQADVEKLLKDALDGFAFSS